MEPTGRERDSALVRDALERRRGPAFERLRRRLDPYIRARAGRSAFAGAAGGHGVDDLVQDVWVKLLADDAKLLRGWDPKRATLPGYVNLIAGQSVVQTLRRDTAQRRRPEGGFTGPNSQAPAAAPNPEQRAGDREALSGLWTHLERQLPTQGALVLRMLYVDRREPKVISQALDMPLPTVHGWRFKIKKLAEAWRARS